MEIKKGIRRMSMEDFKRMTQDEFVSYTNTHHLVDLCDYTEENELVLPDKESRKMFDYLYLRMYRISQTTPIKNGIEKEPIIKS